MRLEETVPVHPQFFGAELEKRVLSELKKKVEGQAHGRYGFVVLVTHVVHMSDGKLHEVRHQ